MNKIWTGALSVLVLLAITKVLIAQPMDEVMGNATDNAMGNMEGMNSEIMMNDDMGHDAGDEMDMHEEAN